MPKAPEGRPTAVPFFFAMSHTYCCSLFHCAFSTKERQKTIVPEIQAPLWAYMGGVAREHGMKALAGGGMDDHVHLLLSLPSILSIAAAMRDIKSASSHWMRESSGISRFEWQEGNGAFSIGWGQVRTTLAYIAGQKEHHLKRNFQAEFLAFLGKHRIEYDPRFVWG
jgi:REP element-mobilizing transposase RayT